MVNFLGFSVHDQAFSNVIHELVLIRGRELQRSYKDLLEIMWGHLQLQLSIDLKYLRWVISNLSNTHFDADHQLELYNMVEIT